MTDFDTNNWQEKLSSTLRGLAKFQKNFLQDYWKTNGFPTQKIFNGQDETPFPIDAYLSIYNGALTGQTLSEQTIFRASSERCSVNPLHP